MTGDLPAIGGRSTFDALETFEALETLFADLARYDRLGLAVSGGADSVALMRLVHSWLQQRRAVGQFVPDVTVLTVDHGLRTESADETQQVAQWAADLAFAHETLVWRGPKPASGVQEAARAARYRLLAGWADGQDADGRVALVLAHHIEDQAETLLMRLGRGSGVTGLAAMRPVNQMDGVAVLRPLLALSKKCLVEYLLANGAEWIEDPSNRSERFERVRVRAERESLERLGMTDQALSLTARRMARAADALEWSTDAVVEAMLADQPVLDLGGFVWRLDPSVPDEIAVRVLGRVLAVVGGTWPDAPELAAIERMVARLRQPDFSGATVGRCQISLGFDGLLIQRETGRLALPKLVVQPGETAIWDGRFEVCATVEDCGNGCPILVQGWDAAADAAIRAEGILLVNEGERHQMRLGQPVFWSNDRVIGVPTLHTGTRSSSSPGSALPVCSARFMHARLRGRG